MSSIFKCELSKAFRKKSFVVSLAVSLIIASASSALCCIGTYQGTLNAVSGFETKWFDPSALSCFRYWVVTDFQWPTTYLFFLILPLLVAIPNARSFQWEFASGYINNVLTRCGKYRYFAAKSAAVFLSSGVIALIPVVTSILFAACYAPARIPDVTSVIYFAVFDDSLWSEVFYSQPVVYVCLYCVLIFTVCGMWGLLVSALGCFVKSKLAIIVGPYLVMLGVKFITENVTRDLIHIELTPIGYLRPSGNLYAPNGWVIIAELVLGLVFVTALLLAKSRRDAL